MRFLFVIPLVALMFIACENPTSDVLLIKKEMAQVTIKLPTQENPRAVGLTAAQAATNYYEVVFRSGTVGNYTYHVGHAASSDMGITLSIPVGTYDIVLLAGYKKDSSFITLLASSYETGRSIAAGNNTVSLTLQTVDVDLVCEDSPPTSTVFDVAVIINTKNPFITPANHHFWLQHNFSSNGDSYSYSYNAAISEDENVENKYTFSYPALTAPTEEPYDRVVRLTRQNSFKLLDNTDTTSVWWHFFDDDYSSSLGSSYQKTIHFTGGTITPNVGIIITWPTE